MKKYYVIFPAIGCVIFAFFFWRFNAEFDANEKAKADIKRNERESKLKADFEAKRKALEEAIALQEKRKVDKAEREKKEAEEKQAQLDLTDSADKAREERDRILRQVTSLQSELRVEEAGIKKIATEKANLLTEDEFLLKYVKMAEANQKSLEQVMTKIQAADKAAELAAAQTAKKK
jgi:preprotein translocase subunit SecF